MSEVLITLDVGGTSVKSALVSVDGVVLDTVRDTPINSQDAADVVIKRLSTIIAAHHAPDYRYRGIVLAFPAPFDYQLGICRIHPSQKKYEHLYGVNLRERIQIKDQGRVLPMWFVNDADAAIAGEAVYGVGKPFPRVIGITLGTGLGAAFLIDGVPQSSGAGVPPDAELYPLLVDGVAADDRFSARGFKALLQAADLPYANARQAYTAAQNGSTQAQTVFARFGADLGAFLQPHVAAFNAQVVLVLGGISEAFPYFAPAMQAATAVPVLKGELGKEAALLGAARLGMAQGGEDDEGRD